MTPVDLDGERDWLDLTDPVGRERWDAMVSESDAPPLPLSAYRDRKRVVRPGWAISPTSSSPHPN